MKDFMTIAKALSDENRVRALMFLREGELCVCQIIEMLGLAPSTVSKHMALLHAAGLVASRKEGRWIYYRRSRARPTSNVGKALDWLDASLSKDVTIRRDEKRLRRVRERPLQECCARYGGR